MDAIFSALLGGSLDIALGSTHMAERWPDVESTSLAELEFRFIGRRGHPAGKLDPCTEADLLEYPIVVPSDPLTSVTLTELYVRNGLPVRTAQYQCDDLATIRSIVRGTDAIAPMVSIGALRGFTRREFHIFDELEDVVHMSLGVAHARSRPLTPAARALLDDLTEPGRLLAD